MSEPDKSSQNQMKRIRAKKKKCWSEPDTEGQTHIKHVRTGLSRPEPDKASQNCLSEPDQNWKKQVRTRSRESEPDKARQNQITRVRIR